MKISLFFLFAFATVFFSRLSYSDEGFLCIAQSSSGDAMFLTNGEIWTKNELNARTRDLIHKKFSNVIRSKYSVDVKSRFGSCAGYNFDSRANKPDDFDVLSKSNKDTISYRTWEQFCDSRTVAFEASSGGYKRCKGISTLDLLKEIKKDNDLISELEEPEVLYIKLDSSWTR